jgi:hypothetical protein
VLLSAAVAAGVLKALSFMFEYIGEMGKDYIYAVTPLLQVGRGCRAGQKQCCACMGLLQALNVCIITACERIARDARVTPCPF